MPLLMRYNMQTEVLPVSESIASTEGEKTLLSDIYLQYRQQMYNLAYSILNNTHDAEDAVQEALYKTARYIPGIQDVNSPKTKALVMTIAESCAIDIYRRNKKQLPFEEIKYDFSHEPRGIGLGDVFAILSPDDREVLLLRYDMGFQVKEIAKMQGRSQNAVTKAIIRAKKHLAQLLDEEGIDYGG